MSYAIEIINLTKEFPQTKSLSHSFLYPLRKMKTTLAVNNINLQVKKGELFGLVGLNGVGKTTLIKMLCCLILPTEGTARVAGYDILINEEKVKAFIGLISGDERSFYWRLTGRQNLQFFASLYNLSPQQAKTKIEELFNFLEINEPDKRFQEYSSGMKQKLAIARCLLNNPEVIFIDEPTKSLDPIEAEAFRKFIKEKLAHKQNKTIFFATHNLKEAEYLADRLAIMHKGRFSTLGTIDELRQMTGDPNATMGEIFTWFINK